MEQQKLRDAARSSLGKSRQIRKAILDKSEELKHSLGGSPKNKAANLTTRLEEIEDLLKQLRLACMEVIFYDFEYAHDKDVEGSLWQAHVVVNAEYRRAVGHVNSQNHVVLKRKVDKLYRDFLKTSQFFYRGYIQRLSGQFYIPELQQVAKGLEADPFVAPQQDPAPSATLRAKLVGSCYLTLVRMGDLARYRCQNTEKPPKSSLDIALTYYGLARMLDPHDGASYHQTAVLYQPSANHLEIIYYFLRSVCVAKPHKLGAANLERAFKGLLSNQPGTKGSSKNLGSKEPSDALTTWFLKLHAYYAQGVIFSAREELEKEVLHRLEVSLKAQGNEPLFLRVMLVNIAACDLVFEKVKDTKDWTIERSRSCQYLLILQVRVAVVLFRQFLSITQDTLNISTTINGDQELQHATSVHTINSIASFERLLPLLRIYIAWIYVSREDLNRYQEWLEPFIRELYGLLAEILTFLLPYATSNSDIPDSKYLLLEDTEALGLKPFADRKLPLFLDVQIVAGHNPPKCRKTVKPRREAVNEQLSSNTESVWRIRDILCCGTYLAGSTKSALTITTTAGNIDTWVYLKDGPLKSIDEHSMTRMFSQVKMTAHKVLVSTEDRSGSASVNVDNPISPFLPRQPGLSSTLQHGERTDADQLASAMLNENHDFGYKNLKLRDEDEEDEMNADPNMTGMVDKLLDEDEDDIYAQTGNTHGDTSYGMDSSAANDVFANLVPSPVSMAPQAPPAHGASSGKAIPNLPWKYFYNPSPVDEPSANSPTGDRFNVPRSISGQMGDMSMNAAGQSAHATDYNKTSSPVGVQYPMHGAQAVRSTQASSLPIAAADPSAATPISNYPDSKDQRAAALDNLKSALFAQYGAGASGSPRSPSFAYGQAAYKPNGDMAGQQGHRAKTSASSQFANYQNPTNLGHEGGNISQGYLGLQLGRPHSGATAQSPIGRAIDMKNETMFQPASPGNRSLGFGRPSSQGYKYSGLTTSPGIGDTAFAQQLSAGSGPGSSLAFTNTSSLWGGTPAVAEAPRGTVACNGNLFDASTAFGRTGNVNNRNDPTHFRNRMRELGHGAGESVAAYDRAILEAALTDSTNTGSLQQ